MTLTKESTPEQWRAAWVEALRSGEYQQGTGSLRHTDFGDARTFYCCLGVACDIAVKAGIGGWIDDNGFHHYAVDGRVPSQKFWGILTPEAANLFGVSVKGDLTEPLNDCDALSSLNDRGLATFEEIADLIEQGKVATTDGVS